MLRSAIAARVVSFGRVRTSRLRFVNTTLQSDDILIVALLMLLPSLVRGVAFARTKLAVVIVIEAVQCSVARLRTVPWGFVAMIILSLLECLLCEFSFVRVKGSIAVLVESF